MEAMIVQIPTVINDFNVFLLFEMEWWNKGPFNNFQVLCKVFPFFINDYGDNGKTKNIFCYSQKILSKNFSTFYIAS